MQILAVPNWSFGRDARMLAQFRDALELNGLVTHYLESDVDHDRTVSAFSGTCVSVSGALVDLCGIAFPTIDLNRHCGVHPRIGALDVCPFITPWGCDAEEMLEWVDEVAWEIAERFCLPVFLFEKSEKGRHEADLPTLRKGGFGSLLERDLEPDFGPPQAHSLLGATVMGWRDFLVAININLSTTDLDTAKRLAKNVQTLRADGDTRFLGVRALSLLLPSLEQCQLNLSLTLPDLTPIDPIIEWVQEQCVSLGIRIAAVDLVGVVRDVDMEHATRLPVNRDQVIKTR